MDINIDEFLAEFDHGRFDEALYQQKTYYLEEIERAHSDTDKAKLAAEYGEVAAKTIIKCFGEWLETR